MKIERKKRQLRTARKGEKGKLQHEKYKGLYEVALGANGIDALK